jgi:hypothetical protein
MITSRCRTESRPNAPGRPGSTHGISDVETGGRDEGTVTAQTPTSAVTAHSEHIANRVVGFHHSVPVLPGESHRIGGSLLSQVETECGT